MSPHTALWAPLSLPSWWKWTWPKPTSQFVLDPLVLLTYREKSTLKTLFSNPSLLLPHFLVPQNQLFCFEVDRSGRKFPLHACPSSCLHQCESCTHMTPHEFSHSLLSPPREVPIQFPNQFPNNSNQFPNQFPSSTSNLNATCLSTYEANDFQTVDSDPLTNEDFSEYWIGTESTETENRMLYTVSVHIISWNWFQMHLYLLCNGSQCKNPLDFVLQNPKPFETLL